MIPKTIHYCWFGGNPLPKDVEKCIASWKKFFPDYEIKEWNEKNFDVNCCDYVREAYNAKKWAFVSDYARFWILYHEGGVYFDTDVEVIKNMTSIIEKGSFMGCELLNKSEDDEPIKLWVNPGLGLGADRGLSIYKEMLELYESIHFINEGGGCLTVVDYTTKVLKKHKWIGKGEIEKIEDIIIYPDEYFCPLNYRTGELNITDNTYSIHWYTASWQSRYSRFKSKVQKILGSRITNKVIQVKKRFKNK